MELKNGAHHLRPQAEDPVGRRSLFRGSAIMGTGFYCILLASSASAEGFRNPPAGAFNLGRAGGRIAQIDDSSAVAQNPANLMDLPDPEF
jgi:hypothetical protein